MAKYVLWIDRENKIVTFRRETGFERMVYERKDMFMSFLMRLSDHSYRFK